MRRKRILEEMRKTPYITQRELSKIIGIGKTAIENNIRFLRENGYLERVGSSGSGYWKVNNI